MWVNTDDPPTNSGDPVVGRLNRILAESGCDTHAELSMGVTMRSSGLCGGGLAAHVNAGRYAK